MGTSSLSPVVLARNSVGLSVAAVKFLKVLYDYGINKHTMLRFLITVLVVDEK